LKAGNRKQAHTPLARSELPVDTSALARFLIGKLLARELPEGAAIGRIVETEAYVIGDAAGHAYGGMTPRVRSLFLERGHAYVYLAYGVSWMLNISSETKGVGAGVLIRALEPLEGIAIMARNRGTERLREDQDGSPRRSGSIVRSTGSTCAGRALCGSRAMARSLARSARGKSERA
jgi:DNA-3-methyladenine glycosylase